jgi:hypothetical protein
MERKNQGLDFDDLFWWLANNIGRFPTSQAQEVRLQRLLMLLGYWFDRYEMTSRFSE